MFFISFSWGRGVRVKYLGLFDGFYVGGGRSFLVMSDIFGVFYSFELGGGRGIWKGEFGMGGDRGFILVL